MKGNSVHPFLAALAVLCLLETATARADGGYFALESATESAAISADQRAILVKRGHDVSMILSTGYTGEGDEFAWIIPTPVAPAISGIRETSADAEKAFALLDRLTAPVFDVMVERYVSSCFPAGTPVATPGTPRPIETITAGTSVAAYDLSKGEWTVAPVRKLVSREYDGMVVSLHLGPHAIEATENHPFYVVRGAGLASRPAPRDVPSGERNAGRGGRWVEARDLRKGDVLLGRTGGETAVTALERRHRRLTVYNLLLDGPHTYAVGAPGVLVHNKGGKEAGSSSSESAAPGPVVKLYGHASLEHYEVNVLGASGASALLSWLQSNGYRVSAAAEQTLDAYIQAGWAFVGVKLTPGHKRHYENELLPALTLTYRSDRLVFPVRISSVSTRGEVAITLYVLADSTVSSPNLSTRRLDYNPSLRAGVVPEWYIESRIQATAGPEGRGIAVLWSGKLKTYWQETLSIKRAAMLHVWNRLPEYLTRLEMRLTPAAMTQDVELAPDPRPKRFDVHIQAGRR